LAWRPTDGPLGTIRFQTQLLSLAIIRRWYTSAVAIGPMELQGNEDGSNAIQIAPFPVSREILGVSF
jgi:hypothetical protein